jgi:universal stress protein E
MTRIQHILVGVDLRHGDRLASKELGDESRAAIREALNLALKWDAKVTFLSVLELSAQSQTLIEHDHKNVFETVEDFARDVLLELVDRFKSDGIPAEGIVRFGVAWEELSKETSTGGYDLLIVGARSKSRASRFLFGGTAQKLIRLAGCPVWVVKPSELREVQDVAIATDLSPASLAATHMAVTVARAINARLHVLHVVEMSDFQYLALAGITEDVLAKTKQRLQSSAMENIQEHLRQTDYRTLLHGTKIEILEGAPDTAIPEYVANEHVDLLVIGSHGHSGVSALLLGNTAERILPALHASLMVVKPANFRSPITK